MAPFQSTGRRRWRRMSTADAEIDQLDGLVRYFRRGLDQLEALTEQTERAEAKRRERAHVTYVPWRDAATAYLIALGVVFVALAAVGVAAVLYQAVASGTAVAGALGALGALMVVAVAAIAVVRPASGESVCPHCCSEARYVAELRQAASAWATAAREQREVVSHLIGSVSAESAASADAEEIPARARNGASGSSPEDDSAAGAAHAERDSRRRSPSPSAAALSRLDELHALRDWRASLAVLREGAEQGEQDPRPDPGLAPPPDRVPGSQRLAAEEERALAAMASREARVGLCWRAARVYMTAASRVGDEECAKDLIRAGLWFTERARHDDPQCARAHTTYAILLSMSGEYEDTKTKISNAYKIRDSAERAIELDGSEAVPHHVLARWCYEVAGVSWVVRRLAATIFGEPPTATYEEALQHFEAADRLTRGQPWKENLFFLAKTFDKLGRVGDAHQVYERVLAAPSRDPSDKNFDDRARAALGTGN